MLGFSRLVKNFDERADAAGFLDFHGASIADLDEYLRITSDHPLQRKFATFHGVIDAHLRRFTSYDAPHSVTFSDSAFVAFCYPVYAYQFAVDVMRDMIIRRTPVRMGIAEGTFRGRRFSSDTTGFVQRYSFQFFGTGVVGAHDAERCGIKGMRILLHPDITVPDANAFCPIADPPDTPRPLKPSVTHELNYAAKGLRLAPTFDEDEREAAFDSDILTVQVSMMKRDSPDVAEVQLQYQRTLEAIVKMRAVGKA
jgi:hypothetical protein